MIVTVQTKIANDEGRLYCYLICLQSWQTSTRITQTPKPQFGKESPPSLLCRKCWAYFLAVHASKVEHIKTEWCQRCWRMTTRAFALCVTGLVKLTTPTKCVLQLLIRNQNWCWIRTLMIMVTKSRWKEKKSLEKFSLLFSAWSYLIVRTKQSCRPIIYSFMLK